LIVKGKLLFSPGLTTATAYWRVYRRVS